MWQILSSHHTFSQQRRLVFHCGAYMRERRGDVRDIQRTFGTINTANDDASHINPAPQ